MTNGCKYCKLSFKKWYSFQQYCNPMCRELFYKDWMKVNRIKYKGRYNEYDKNYNKKSSQSRKNTNKKIVFERLGNKCIICGESGHDFLNIDHIHNNGKVEREMYGDELYRRYVKLEIDELKENYQIMCWNCNWMKHKSLLRVGDRSKRISEKYYDLRYIVIQHYGTTCNCCGISYYDLLTIDHVNGDGHVFKKEHPKLGQGMGFFKWIIKNNFPKDLQILCRKCNCAKRNSKQCPHQKD